MKNDFSFIIVMHLYLYEHQPTYSPDLPLRFFDVYIGYLPRNYLGRNPFRIFKEELCGGEKREYI